MYINKFMEFKPYFEEYLKLGEKMNDTAFIKPLEELVAVMEKCFKSGGKLLIAGNGGSAADAQHFAAEFVGRYKKEGRGFPAIALTTDSSILTAWSNDYSFADVFARQIRALGKAGDVCIGISTSGRSENIIAAIGAAGEMGLVTVALIGGDGGGMKGMADIEIIVPSENTPRIQEAHTLILHMVTEEVEKNIR
jgi:D-sedoheptulose 7-phosphate isomerase